MLKGRHAHASVAALDTLFNSGAVANGGYLHPAQ